MKLYRLTFRLFLLLLSFGMISCFDITEELTADEIINKAIAAQCEGNCDEATVTFAFRDRTYISKQINGSYDYSRITKDSSGTITDRLTNYGFTRAINDQVIPIPDSMAVRYENSVNSVIYFAMLPYGLNAPAVQKELLGETILKKEPYYEIKVTFSEEGGGTDHEDEFLYWIHRDNFTVDYLAYSYQTNGGGIRFREAYNPRRVEGIRFVDYRNYKPSTTTVQLQELDSLFVNDRLELLSLIETEDVRVSFPEALEE